MVLSEFESVECGQTEIFFTRSLSELPSQSLHIRVAYGDSSSAIDTILLSINDASPFIPLELRFPKQFSYRSRPNRSTESIISQN
jgi:hypothetical protein